MLSHNFMTTTVIILDDPIFRIIIFKTISIGTPLETWKATQKHEMNQYMSLPICVCSGYLSFLSCQLSWHQV